MPRVIWKVAAMLHCLLASWPKLSLGETLSLSNIFLHHLYIRKVECVEQRLQQYWLNSSSCIANTCGDTWREKGSVRGGRK